MSEQYPSFSLFEEICTEQSATIHPAILRVADFERRNVLRSPEYLNYRDASIVCGNLLREQPDIELADKVIEFPGGDSDLDQFAAPKNLIRLINGTVEPATGLPWSQTYICQGSSTIKACSFAEDAFSTTFAQMRAGSKRLHGENRLFGYQIITGEGNQPIAVRKSLGVTSTLSLVDLAVNGVVYPPGSLFRADFIDEYKNDHYETHVGSRSFATLPAERISHLSFRRFTSFVEAAKHRSKFDPRKLPREASRIYQRFDVGQIKDLATLALDHANPL